MSGAKEEVSLENPASRYLVEKLEDIGGVAGTNGIMTMLATL